MLFTSRDNPIWSRYITHQPARVRLPVWEGKRYDKPHLFALCGYLVVDFTKNFIILTNLHEKFSVKF